MVAERGTDAQVRVSLLGGFRISAGETELDDRAWRLRKAAALVKLLCLSAGHRRRRDELLDILWPDLAPDAAVNNLHYTLHIARRTLASAFPSAGQWLHMRAGVVELKPDQAMVVDVEEMEIAAAAADGSGDPALYATALEGYAGDLLPDDVYEDWTVGRREQLRDRYRALLQQKARLHEQRGEHAAAVQTLALALASEPASEESHAALMRLYARAGQRDQALRQFQQLQEALRRELDAEPDPATQRLYEEILSGRLAALAPAAAGWDSAAPAQRKHNIPYALTSFIGRRSELAELPELLNAHRLVTLAGTGGCGKTRLALEVGHALVERAADGVWLVELAALKDGRLVPQTVAAAVGVEEEPARPLLETLCRRLAERDLVLVMDNCEHVAVEAAAVVDALLRAAPALRVLATSREPLGIVGEVVRRVASLGVPDERMTDSGEVEESEAVRLFVDRARRVRPELRLGAGNAASIAQICRRLDGIPLAIELAAARADTLSVQEIAERLNDCFHLLTNGGRTAAARHQTLRAAVDWSYVLLSEAERALFGQLAVFGGAFTLEAAEAVCDGDVLTLLAQLVSKSLVVIAAETTGEAIEGTHRRYRLLEPLRQYAAERLRDGGDDEPVRRRHGRYFAALAEKAEELLAGPDQVAWLERLEAELEDFRAALRWSLEAADAEDAVVGVRLAAALAPFWLVRSNLEEGDGWLARAVVRSAGLPDLDQAERARLLAEAGSVATARGDYGRAVKAHNESLALRRATQDARGTGWCLTSLGDVAYARGDYAAAAPLYEEALDHLREAADQRGIATAYGSLGYVARHLGNYGYADALCRQSLRVYEELGDRRGRALALSALGYVAGGTGDHAAAAGYYAQSLENAQALGARGDMARALEGLAAALTAQGGAAEAALLLGGADALRGASGAARADVDEEDYALAVERVKAALGEQECALAWQRGATLSTAELVERAMAAGQIPERVVSGRMR